jgi:hypothetical protein
MSYNTDDNNYYDYTQTQLFYNLVYNTLDSKNRSVDKTKELVLSNIYSYKKTKAHNKLLFVIIIICIVLIIIGYLNNKYMLVSDTVYSITMGIILGFAFIYIGYSIWVFSFRDKLNYDEYDYGKFGTINKSTNKTTASDIKAAYNTDYTTTDDTSGCEVSTIDDSDKTISAFFKTL